MNFTAVFHLDSYVSVTCGLKCSCCNQVIDIMGYLNQSDCTVS